ncbi:hypothetical protein PTKU15_92580 [Paraburkholderia terrae]|nr:hypothetical protein PTKU15_92580 [Paraburkholderia terrae]
MLGGSHMVTRAVSKEQRSPNGFFKFAHLLAYCRLRSMHAFTGACETAFIDDANQRLQQFEVKHDSSFSFPLMFIG